jgi:hypothetical protein
VPLGPPACANAKVPDSANAEANAIVASFMGPFLFVAKGGRADKCDACGRAHSSGLLSNRRSRGADHHH